MDVRDKILRVIFIRPLGIATRQSTDKLAIPDRNLEEAAISLILTGRLYEREVVKITGELMDLELQRK